jgi:hypothetical protein
MYDTSTHSHIPGISRGSTLEQVEFNVTVMGCHLYHKCASYIYNLTYMAAIKSKDVNDHNPGQPRIPGIITLSLLILWVTYPRYQLTHKASSFGSYLFRSFINPKPWKHAGCEGCRSGGSGC